MNYYLIDVLEQVKTFLKEREKSYYEKKMKNVSIGNYYYIEGLQHGIREAGSVLNDSINQIKKEDSSLKVNFKNRR